MWILWCFMLGRTEGPPLNGCFLHFMFLIWQQRPETRDTRHGVWCATAHGSDSALGGRGSGAPITYFSLLFKLINNLSDEFYKY
jgi:hypothetical protein